MHLNNSKPDTFVRTYCSLSVSPWLQCLISSRQEILRRAGKTDHCESVREAKWVWASMSVLYICHDPSPISPQVLAFFFFFLSHVLRVIVPLFPRNYFMDQFSVRPLTSPPFWPQPCLNHTHTRAKFIVQDCRVVNVPPDSHQMPSLAPTVWLTFPNNGFFPKVLCWWLVGVFGTLE